MEKLLTISIAAYNVEKYIQKTLDSLVIPEIIDELEVFIIDDGGNDNTVALAKEYENRYPNTFHIIQKKNGGYGTTVNWSVEHATGKFIKLLDGDDWVDAKGLKALMECLQNTEADVVVSNAAFAQEGSEIKEMYPHCREYNHKLMTLEEASKCPVVAMWGYTFRTQIVRKSFKLLPSHTLYTDQIFVMRALESAETIEYVGDIVYYWRLGREEQSNNIKSIRKHYEEVIKVADIISEEYHKLATSNMSKKFSYQLKRAAAYYSVSVAMLCKLEHNRRNLNLIKNWEKRTKEKTVDIYHAANSAKKLFLLRMSGYLLYWFLK
ncbi:glycosyltransferase family 2 protein [Clostridium beijerinckii]|uniref:Putative glycosyltransferase EpsH n=1 Tax=Clostridium beijerinckii TaxID=1520 RepID=A0A1S8RV41_CLOBE|nr:glycosyltransferase family 2 protein [Clostridium beijerinckii]NRY62049.1 glycosyltransferase involved in cell wall biosynthesis [Clostridium beijerinckii]OOM57081.1 putative glycosyltransferase EpsH [Clostridium beijerinckii]